MPERKRSDWEAFIRALPDERAARTFLEKLEGLDPVGTPARLDPLLLSRLLTIAAYSPFLADTLLRHPNYIAWLRHETGQDLGSGKSVEQLSEELARFLARITDNDQQSGFAHFKRRELLRIYLRDCLGIATLAEVTEELSNLADSILKAALAIAQQEMINRHGMPTVRDERGRIEAAEFAIVALGKLGCRELNYASDIDLIFLYSGVGQTAGDGRRADSAISNKEFFTAVAGRVVQMIGSNSGEGAVYRIDLRLRPYGRDGDLVWETGRAVDYYRSKAHNWERQALIRARATAGSEPAVIRFLEMVRDVIFSREALPNALADVRRAKEKIDRQAATRTGGFNVKLGRGGIREIEFIAQALQLEYGGREPWVRSTQTLIVLARLAEKGYLSEPERARLSAAYTFLRTVEHRLQMEQGVQTHTLPLARERLELVARRSGYLQHSDPASAFAADLEAHTSSVRAVYERVFAENQSVAQTAPSAATKPEELDDETARLIRHAAARLLKAIGPHRPAGDIERFIRASLASAINPLRSLRNFAAWAESLATYDKEPRSAIERVVAGADLPSFIERMIPVLSSQYLFHILVSRPVLAVALTGPRAPAENYLKVMREAIERESGVASKTEALRRSWYRQVVEIGCQDVAGAGCEDPSAPPAQSLRESNLKQTRLAEASLNLSVEIALASMGVDPAEADRLPFALLGLGRLGHAGMDYGSDLDLLIVFDDSAPLSLTGQGLSVPGGPEYSGAQEFYAKLTAQLVRVLSSITREGFLYRIDLRLRPDGRSGPLALGLGGFLAYVRERASAWEHSAYLKAREVAGNLSLGARARQLICDASFERARRNPSLKEELAAMRARLEKEKAASGRPNIKWGRGGMSDVYFITRYLQLRDSIYFPPEQGTTALIAHLGERGSLDQPSARVLFEGYSFLRFLDHWMRLLVDRPTPVLPASESALRDISRALCLASVEEVERECARHATEIRGVYEATFG